MAFRVLGIAGSLRAGSYNHAPLAAAVDLVPVELEFIPSSAFARSRPSPAPG